MIDCATPACSVALFEDEELISGTFEVLGRGHAERLVPMIADLPERGRASSIAVARGPGSFTGVRIGGHGAVEAEQACVSMREDQRGGDLRSVPRLAPLRVERGVHNPHDRVDRGFADTVRAHDGIRASGARP